MFDSVPLRLTLWYVAALSLILVVFSIAGYIFVARNLQGRLDISLRATLETVVAALQQQGATMGKTGSEGIGGALQKLHFPNQAVALMDAKGRRIIEKTSDDGVHVRLPPSGMEPGSTGFYSLPEQNSESDDSCRGLVRRVRVASPNQLYWVVVNQSLEPIQDQLDLVQDVLDTAVPGAVFSAGLGGWLLARRSLAPVMAMSAQAKRISAENLHERLPIVNPRDELGRLAATFNDLLKRVGDSLYRQRQFVADASHELRTPLSAIRTTSTVMLQREDREQTEYRHALTIVEQQAQRLTHIVEQMFVLARADAEYRTLQISQIYLDEVLAETARAAAVLASNKAIELEVPSFPEAPFHGDEGLLRQMIWNLLDNAIHYTAIGGRARITLELHDSNYVITVTDTGKGIPADVQPYIFERFYRADEARAHDEIANAGGAGLGLPIARWIAEAHHGHLELQCSSEAGSSFVVFMPRA